MKEKPNGNDPFMAHLERAQSLVKHSGTFLQLLEQTGADRSRIPTNAELARAFCMNLETKELEVSVFFELMEIMLESIWRRSSANLWH
ncbi:MAG: hypothetical protein ABSE41_14505 [Bacteroidota bacterium]|jgi:hypothetical protein